MAPTLMQIVGSIQELPSSKWYWDINHFAESLEISVPEVNGFIRCIEKGGTGLKSDDSWLVNPKPYNKPINISSLQDNLLNLHVTSIGDKRATAPNITQPSIEIIDRETKFMGLGRVTKRNKLITAKLQRDIIKMVIGTHRGLKKFPDVAEFRQTHWKSWIDGTGEASQYQIIHVPHIAKWFWDVWEAPVDRQEAATEIPQSILEMVKKEVIELMVRMYILPVSMLANIVVRRSKRGRDKNDEGGDNEITPIPTKKPRRSLTTTDSSSSEEDDDGMEIEVDPIKRTLALFNYGTLKDLYR